MMGGCLGSQVPFTITQFLVFEFVASSLYRQKAPSAAIPPNPFPPPFSAPPIPPSDLPALKGLACLSLARFLCSALAKEGLPPTV